MVMARHIVVIDDDLLLLTIAKDFLTGAGFRVSTSDTTVYSNELIYAQDPPDLIFLDVVMPLMTGDRKVMALKRRKQSRDIPVILISTKPEEELRALAAQAGADGYLQKPFTPESLVAKIHEYLPPVS